MRRREVFPETPFWNQARARFAGRVEIAELPASMVERFRGALALTQQLRAAGVTILAGSDSPFASGFQGVQLHAELRLLTDAGLTATEALVAATSAPADVFGLKDRGRIRSGLRADLLLVEGDLTEHIEHTVQIVGVFKAGQPVHQEALIAAAHASTEARCPARTQPQK